MNLERYFERIGYSGATAPGPASLRAIMRAHLAAIPFENIDVQLRRPITGAMPAIFAKLVDDRRGGWCFEQNGLLGWALEQLGFDVTRIAGGVMRVAAGDQVLGNHLALIVTLDRPWLVDVGFGGSLAEPIPLVESAHRHPPYDLTLAEIEDGYWRYEESTHGKPFSFDFRPCAAEPDLLGSQQARLQSDPGSPFVQNLVVQQRIGDSHVSLRGRVLTVIDDSGFTESKIANAEALVAMLRDRFHLDVPEIANCWPAICARHAALFGDD